MSSSHLIIVARNYETGELQLPLENLTLYGMGQDPETKLYEEDSLVQECAKKYGPEWGITLYVPVGPTYSGSK